MEPLLCFPKDPPAAVVAVLERSGYPWLGIDRSESVDADEPEDGWAGAVICSGTDPTAQGENACGTSSPCVEYAGPREALSPVRATVRQLLKGSSCATARRTP